MIEGLSAPAVYRIYVQIHYSILRSDNKFVKLMLHFGKFAFNSQKRNSHFLEINSPKNAKIR